MNRHTDAMKIAFACLCLVLTGLPVVAQSPAAIEGLWKHRDKPAWIEISFESGVGTAVIVRHDDNPDAKGSDIMIEIVPDESSPSRWRSKMWAAATDDFVEVSMELKDPDHLVVTYGDEDILHLERESPAHGSAPELES